MVLVFDMDDTLYEEASYVQSGFKAVAAELSPILKASALKLYGQMLALLKEHGRGRVFDMLLRNHGRHSTRRVRDCVHCYRMHRPRIRLHAAGRACLLRFGDVPLYVVTDGNKNAQAAKARALGLEKLVRRVFITHRHGLQHAKPSPYCFQKIQALEQVPSEQIVYVADDPTKDFLGIRPLGFRTIRVLTGRHAAVRAKPGAHADITISSLNELTHKLLAQLGLPSIIIR